MIAVGPSELNKRLQQDAHAAILAFDRQQDAHAAILAFDRSKVLKVC